uniref:Putative rna-directed dna polymerase from transposon x-element n=1 Tax=Ixodes ricinus TaxID=34613 RepID=A0A6B0UNC1_IXORI
MHHKALTVCSLYLPPSFTLKCSDFNSLLDQLPEPFLLMRDFNCHNPLWGSTRQDVKGKIVESVLSSRSLCLFNTGQPTYFSLSSLSSTSIDLLIGSATLLPDFSWSVDSNPRGSDYLLLF